MTNVRKTCENLEPLQQIFEDNAHNIRDTIGSEEDEEYRNWIPSFSSLQSALYRERKKIVDVKKLVFNSLEEVVIPKTLKNDLLVCEDGTDDKILIFASRIVKKFIENAKLGSYVIKR